MQRERMSVDLFVSPADLWEGDRVEHNWTAQQAAVTTAATLL